MWLPSPRTTSVPRPVGWAFATGLYGASAAWRGIAILLCVVLMTVLRLLATLVTCRREATNGVLRATYVPLTGPPALDIDVYEGAPAVESGDRLQF